jgi:hypothetical protein
MENELKDILFKIGQEIKVHRLDNDNLIIEIDYDKYVSEILGIFKSHRNDLDN